MSFSGFVIVFLIRLLRERPMRRLREDYRHSPDGSRRCSTNVLVKLAPPKGAM